jgi:transposase
VEIAAQYTHDATQLPALLKTTAKNFTMAEVSADMGYLSHGSLAAIASHGAEPFIPFKPSSKCTTRHPELWRKMFHLFQYSRDTFMAHYHKRSNVESTFSMVKAKFRDHLRSKTDVAMANECLCKFICHNICCVIQEMHELGIAPTFWAEAG